LGCYRNLATEAREGDGGMSGLTISKGEKRAKPLAVSEEQLHHMT